MDLLHDLGLGFAVALSAQNLLCVMLGAMLGMLVGVLPGTGATLALALLLPATAGLDATPALLLLAAVYCGAQYGASTTAILIELPGAAAADGCQLARQGRAGAALWLAALGGWFAGSLGTLLVALLALPLAELAFRFGPAEYFALMVLGLVAAAAFAAGSFAKALAMMLLGLLLAQVGTDAASGTSRFSFELPQLAGGIGWVVVALGGFGAADVIARLARTHPRSAPTGERVGRVRPTAQELREAWPSVLRGSLLGSLLGLLPGQSALLASFASYGIEKRVLERPRVPFGKGAVQGVAGPESASHAAAQTAFVPMLAFGVPANAVMALLIGALALRGVHAGPQLLTGQPQLFWGLLASMWIGNLVLLALSLPLVDASARLLRVPYRLVFPTIVLLCCLGAYALGHRTFDVHLLALVAVLAYGLGKLGCELAPLLLGFIMAPALEDNLRQALRLAGGDWKLLAGRPLTSALLIGAALLVVVVALPSVRQKREVALLEH